MKILFITDEFYPVFGANSLVVKTLCDEFIKSGQDVFVMPFWYDKTLSKEEIYEGIKIVRQIPSDDKENFKANLKKGRIFDCIKVLGSIIKTKINRKPCVRVNSGIFARNFLKRWIEENKIDVVISINCSIELSFPLLYLKKHKKLNCKWIFYMIDPFESHEYYRSIASEKKLRKTQHEIMKLCYNIVATDLIYRDTEKWESKEILDKIIVLGFPKIVKPSVIACGDDIEIDKSMVNIVCTGSKNDVARDSRYTIELCESLMGENIRFYFVGAGWTSEDKETGNVRYCAKRSWQAVVNLQQNADFLLNIGNIALNQLPSKILEYISAGKPIINIYKNDNCPTLELLKGYDALNLADGTPISEAKNKLIEFVFENHEKIMFSDIVKKYCIYTPEYIADRFLAGIK